MDDLQQRWKVEHAALVRDFGADSVIPLADFLAAKQRMQDDLYTPEHQLLRKLPAGLGRKARAEYLLATLIIEVRGLRADLKAEARLRGEVQP